jgi:hypothetical protein
MELKKMIPRTPALRLLVVLFLSVSFPGCANSHEFVNDHELLMQVHEYFPNAVLYKFDKRVLWIQTQVDGVSGRFAEKTLESFLQESDSAAMQRSFGTVHFSNALAHDGYVYLVAGFQQNVVVWDRRTVVGPDRLPATLHWLMDRTTLLAGK